MLNMKLFLTWSSLVILNSILSLLFTLDFLKSVEGFLGITLGLLTYVLIYMYLDDFFAQKGKEAWRRALIAAVVMVKFFCSNLKPVFSESAFFLQASYNQ